MKHTIPRKSWASALADALESAQDGDTIEIHNETMQELAERAHQRMYPDKELVFEIKTPSPLRSIWYSEE